MAYDDQRWDNCSGIEGMESKPEASMGVFLFIEARDVSGYDVTVRTRLFGKDVNSRLVRHPNTSRHGNVSHGS